MAGPVWKRVDDAAWAAGLRLRVDKNMVGSRMAAEWRRDGKVTKGRHGRLFLARDSHSVIDQHTGRIRLSERTLEGWRTQLEERTAMLAQRGSRYAMLIAPDAHALYPEDLPRSIKPVQERPVHQLLSHLEEHDSTAQVIYPLAEMVARKQDRELVPRTDTHWNEFGAYVAYTHLAERLGAQVALRQVVDEDLWWKDELDPGDLGIKRRLPRKSRRPYGYMRHPALRLVSDNGVEATGTIAVYECPAAPPTTCLICGDSYTIPVLAFLGESFRRLVFAQTPTLDAGLVEQERPDVVLTVISERFLTDVYSDADHVPVEEQARAKLAKGDRRMSMSFRWPGVNHVSPVLVERVRAQMRAAGRLADAALVSMLAYSPLRSPEVRRLRWKDVNGATLHVRPVRNPRTNGSGQPRAVRMLDPLARDIDELRAAVPDAGENDIVFPSPSGGRWRPREWQQWTEECYTPLAIETGLPFERPNALLNTFVSLRLHAGASLTELAAELGVESETLRQHERVIADLAHAGHASAESTIERARALAARG